MLMVLLTMMLMSYIHWSFVEALSESRPTRHVQLTRLTRNSNPDGHGIQYIESIILCMTF